MTIHLDILTGHASGLSKRFDQGVVTLGRDPGSDVGFHPTLDTAVSRGVHARINADSAGGGPARLEVLHASGVGIVGRDGVVSRRVGQGETVDLPAQAELEIGVNGPRVRVTDMSQPLPGTEDERGQGMLPEARVSAGMRKQVGATHRGLKATGVVVLLAIAAGAVAYAAMSGRVTETEKGLAITAGQLSGINRALHATRMDPPAPLASALAKAAPSVWVVGVAGSGTKSFVPLGTAWTAAPGKLATNAHVVEGLEELLAKNPSLSPVAQRDGTGAGRLRLGKAMFVHPGYRAWLAEQKRPIAHQTPLGGGLEWLSLIEACDVGLLTVEEGDAGEPLRLASDPQSTRPGSPIGYVGYPMEGIPGFPARQSVVGTLSARTDYFFGMEEGGQPLLIHHTAVSRGGASGSPLINSAGEVIGVHSAGSVIGTTESGDRISAGIQYGQGVEVVKELLSGDAATAQKQREESWQRASESVRMGVKDANPRYARALAGKSGSKTVLNKSGQLNDAGQDHRLVYTTRLEAGGAYVVSVYAEGPAPIVFAVLPMESGKLVVDKSGDPVVLASQSGKGVPVHVTIPARAKAIDVAILVWASEKPASATTVSTVVVASAP